VTALAKQRRRGTEAQHAGFTGLEGEITVNTTDFRLHVHDHITAGGHKTAKLDEIGPWLDSVDYPEDRLVVSGRRLYVSLEASGPGTAAGAKDPADPENAEFWGNPTSGAPAAGGEIATKEYVDASYLDAYPGMQGVQVTYPGNGVAWVAPVTGWAVLAVNEVQPGGAVTVYSRGVYARSVCGPSAKQLIAYIPVVAGADAVVLVESGTAVSIIIRKAKGAE
jgi:hypothetical protein